MLVEGLHLLLLCADCWTSRTGRHGRVQSVPTHAKRSIRNRHTGLHGRIHSVSNSYAVTWQEQKWCDSSDFYILIRVLKSVTRLEFACRSVNW